VAIPLETFVHSLRTVVGLIAIGVMRLFCFALRLVGGLFVHLGAALVRIYDIVVFLPLWIELIWRGQKRPAARNRPNDHLAEVRS
jgi:hypothetical protein